MNKKLESWTFCENHLHCLYNKNKRGPRMDPWAKQVKGGEVTTTNTFLTMGYIRFKPFVDIVSLHIGQIIYHTKLHD